MRALRLLESTVLAVMVPGALWGQAVVRAGSEDFDIERAIVYDSTRFEPFLVEGTRSLRRALREGIVQDNSRLIVLDHELSPIALVLDQMAYHHAAQGEIEGEPWMVSF